MYEFAHQFRSYPPLWSRVANREQTRAPCCHQASQLQFEAQNDAQVGIRGVIRQQQRDEQLEVRHTIPRIAQLCEVINYEHQTKLSRYEPSRRLKAARRHR